MKLCTVNVKKYIFEFKLALSRYCIQKGYNRHSKISILSNTHFFLKEQENFHFYFL